MIEPKLFFDALKLRGIGYYMGVPDSLLANFCAYVDDHGEGSQHLITANEGNAVGLAMGYHMASGKLAAVYMQNSGLGNTVNPLTSLADMDVYKVPMLLVIGWRGEPGVKDEPQHVKQGRVTLEQLELLDIPYWILDANSQVNEILNQAFTAIQVSNAPVALVVRKNTFDNYKSKKIRQEISMLGREKALECLLKLCSENDLIISTTGRTSREVFELRAHNNQQQQDFLTVGGMGHASSIALGVAIGRPDRRVVCLDGDGALIMHMGAMPVIASFNSLSFIHVVLNNRAHESVGGQATSADNIDFEKLSQAVGYAAYAGASNLDQLQDAWNSLMLATGPVLLEVKVCRGSRADLGRPTSSAEQNKIVFMEATGAIK